MSWILSEEAKRLRALADALQSTRWRALSVALQQAEEFEKELDALGYVIVAKPAQTLTRSEP